MSSGLTDFLEMGGYAVFVWGSFGCAAAVYLWNLIAPRAQRREILQQLSEIEA